MYRFVTNSLRQSESIIGKLNPSIYRNVSVSDRPSLNLKQVHGICGCGQELYIQYRYALNGNGYSHGCKQCGDCKRGCREFFCCQSNKYNDIIGYCCNKRCKLHFLSSECDHCTCNQDDNE